MKVIDLHCDTLSELWHAKEEGRKADFKSGRQQVSLDKLMKGGYMLQTFAAFVNLGWEKDPLTACMEEIEIFKEEMARFNSQIMQVTSWKDIEKCQQQGKIGALLSIEEGGVCKGRLENLRAFYKQGVRMMTLTWNYENELAYPNAVPGDSHLVYPCKADTAHGLKSMGRAFVEEMEQLGMIIDVSHLSDKGFYDVAACTHKPFIASHSNARRLCSHARNLEDDMLKIIGDRGGLVGLNYCASFLQEKEENQEVKSTIADMVRHAKYIIDHAGSSSLALGSDYDGIEGDLEMPDCSYLQQLSVGMEKAGFSETQIEKIFYKNALTFLKENL